jgi:hypothetical protein
LQRASNFFDLGLAKKAFADWRKYWFYVKVTPEGEVKMPRYSVEPSMPRLHRVKSLPEGQRALVGQMLQTILQLDREGLKSFNLYNYWLTQRLILLQQRAHPTWKYTEAGDLTRLTGTEWEEKEYVAALKKITAIQFKNLDEGLQLFTP